jgi:hypothetical protein
MMDKYIDCIRCRKIKRFTDMQDNVCNDCRSVEFSDYVIATLSETMPYTVFFAKIYKEARRLGLTQTYQADSTEP